MKCYACNCRLSPDRDTCPKCGADIRLYRKIIYASNQYYNLGLARAKARDLTGAAECLRTSLQLYKKNISARNLLGLVYYEMGEAALALKEWVISKNLRHRGNIADDYIRDMRDNRQSLDSADHSIRKFNQALEYAKTGSKDMAVIQLKKVINVNPRMIKAYQLLALLYMEDQKYDQALDGNGEIFTTDHITYRDETAGISYMVSVNLQNGEIKTVSAEKDTGSNYSKKIAEDAAQYQGLSLDAEKMAHAYMGENAVWTAKQIEYMRDEKQMLGTDNSRRKVVKSII